MINIFENFNPAGTGTSPEEQKPAPNREGLVILCAKISLLVFLAVFLVLLCFSGNYKDKPVFVIEQAMFPTKGISSLTKGSDNDLRRCYGLSAEDYDGYFLYLSESTMAVDELLVVKLKDSSQAAAVEEQIEGRLNSQIDAFDGYGAEQTALLKAHVLERMGNYIFFAVSEEADSWKADFVSCIKK